MFRSAKGLMEIIKVMVGQKHVLSYKTSGNTLSYGNKHMIGTIISVNKEKDMPGMPDFTLFSNNRIYNCFINGNNRGLFGEKESELEYLIDDMNIGKVVVVSGVIHKSVPSVLFVHFMSFDLWYYKALNYWFHVKKVKLTEFNFEALKKYDLKPVSLTLRDDMESLFENDIKYKLDYIKIYRHARNTYIAVTSYALRAALPYMNREARINSKKV